jgi:hypothetical protein
VETTDAGGRDVDWALTDIFLRVSANRRSSWSLPAMPGISRARAPSSTASDKHGLARCRNPHKRAAV